MTSFVALCILLGIGHFLRSRIKLFQKLYLPSCVIGGLFGLLVIQILSAGSGNCVICESASTWLDDITAPWQKLPSFLINIVFACLFLGVKLPKFSEIWKRSAPQVVYGQIVAWGQYVVGLGLWVFVLSWIFTDLPGMFAGILPVGFEGGHGTAAGMGPVFADHGWPEGQDLAMTSATFGIMSAIIVGTILVNWAVRKGYAVRHKELSEQIEDDSIAVIPVDQRPIAGRLTVNSDVIEAFSLHLVAVGLAVGIGMLIKNGLLLIEAQVPYLANNKLLTSFPLFPLCMIGGLIIQFIELKYDKRQLIDLGLIRRIQNCSLDFLVIAAIAMIQIAAVKAALVPLLILVAAGIAWNVFCVTTLARRILPDAWFERAIAEMGQSMGVTATGLLLLRMVDPDYDTPAADAFACKQIVHEPFMGGGLWTSTAIPLIAIYGPGRIFIVALVVISIWLAIGWKMRCKRLA
ncbi:MAG: sodium:glutamate symporter [Planctomycetes bacterium]|nr:sodium:glutamate symporter [Planctomycetota bacterium]